MPGLQANSNAVELSDRIEVMRARRPMMGSRLRRAAAAFGVFWLMAAAGAAASALDDLPAGASAWLSEQPAFLPVDEAFVMSAEVAPDGAILVRWDIAEGYYCLLYTSDAADE